MGKGRLNNMKTVIVKDHIDNECIQFTNVEKILVCSTDFILVMSNGTENRFIKPFYSYEVIEDDGKSYQQHKADNIDIPDDTIMYMKGKWLVINTESEQLGKAIKMCIDYCCGERKNNNG